jgi:hypothetical protein
VEGRVHRVSVGEYGDGLRIALRIRLPYSGCRNPYLVEWWRVTPDPVTELCAGSAMDGTVGLEVETRRRDLERLAGRDLWLVDDVTTSGETLGVCRQALRGFRVGGALVLARAGLASWSNR